MPFCTFLLLYTPQGHRFPLRILHPFPSQWQCPCDPTEALLRYGCYAEASAVAILPLPTDIPGMRHIRFCEQMWQLRVKQLI